MTINGTWIHRTDTSSAVRQVRHHRPPPTPDGRTVLARSPLEFLAALSPHRTPRVHRHREHGVLAPGAARRARVVALRRHERRGAVRRRTNPDVVAATPTVPARSTSPAPRIERPATHLRDAPQPTAARSRGSRLLVHLRGVPTALPGCGADMRILAFITAAEPVDVILRHLGRPPHRRTTLVGVGRRLESWHGSPR